MVGRTRRVTLADAAQALGISKEAVRKRVSRGTLPSDVGEDGRRHVYLDVGRDATAGGDDNNVNITDPRDELIATLKEQLEAERNAHAETRRIAYTLAQRVPELEARASEATEATGGPETATEEPYSTHAPPTPESAIYGTSPQEAADSLQRRPSWWKRFFGLE
jgi:hypothetical protein